MLRRWEHAGTVYGYPPNSIQGKSYCFGRRVPDGAIYLKFTATGLFPWIRLCVINVQGALTLFLERLKIMVLWISMKRVASEGMKTEDFSQFSTCKYWRMTAIRKCEDRKCEDCILKGGYPKINFGWLYPLQGPKTLRDKTNQSTKQSFIAFGNHKIMLVNPLTKTQELDPIASHHKSTARSLCNPSLSPDHKWSKKLWEVVKLFNYIVSTKWLTIHILDQF